MLTIIPLKSITRITECFLFDVKKNSIVVTATNEHMQASYILEVNTIDEFKFCVPAKLFTETIRYFSASDIEVSLKDDVIHLKNGKSNYKIATERVDVYPIYDFPNPVSSIRLNSQVFLSGAAKCSTIVDEQNKVPVMSGISIRNDLGKVSMTGSLHQAIMNYEVGITEQFSFTECVVPKQSITGIRNIMGDNTCTLTINGKKLKVSSLNCEIVSVLLDYKYPDINRFFKLKSKNFVRLNRVELQSALTRLKLYSSKEEMSLVNISIKGDLMTLDASDLFSNNFGHEELSLPIDNKIVGEYSFNLELMYNGVFQTDGEMIDLFFGDLTNPLFISSVSSLEGASTDLILMQINK